MMMSDKAVIGEGLGMAAAAMAVLGRRMMRWLNNHKVLGNGKI